MRRFTALLLAALMLLSLAACGQGASAGGSAQNAAGDPTPEEEAPELPEPEPYEISDPTVMPEGGVRDGVTYAAYDGIVEHLFFHPVVAYPELAFDGDAQANGIDDYMVTVDEYNKILQSVYDKGYVLVDIGDVWSETTGEDGQPKMVRNTLYLPEGKKPLILSYDDTNYYEYMLANGFTYKLVIGEDGKIASWGKDPQGNEVTSRDLDAIPILDKFVEEHPDFSPFGAKGCLSLTGTDGKAKMSKSLGNCIYLSDSADEVQKKVKSMYTDPDHLRVQDPGKLEGNTVFTYLDAFCRPEHFGLYLPEYPNLDELKAHYQRGGLGDMKVKKFLNEIMQETLEPIRNRRKEFEKDIPAIYDMLKKGCETARETAAATLDDVRKAMKINYFDDAELIAEQVKKFGGE